MSTGVKRVAGEEKPEALPLLNETVLGMIRAQAPLPKILEILCTDVEKQHPGLLCSVLLLDGDGMTLRHGAAPSLPAEYSRAVDGAKSGPCAGSCGTAVHRKQSVVVSDIATDPLWADCRLVALPYGLRACWSTPIVSQDGKVLGTFAIYYREPRTPDAEHQRLITHATHLAGIAIEHDHTKTELRAAEARYRTLVERFPPLPTLQSLAPADPGTTSAPRLKACWASRPRNGSPIP